MVGVDGELARQARPSQGQRCREEEEHRPDVLDGGRHVDDGRACEGVVLHGARPDLKPDVGAGSDCSGDRDDDDPDRNHADDPNRNHAANEPDNSGQSRGRGAALCRTDRLIRFLSIISF